MTVRHRQLSYLSENVVWTVQQIESLFRHLGELEEAMQVLGVNTDARAKMLTRMEDKHGHQESCHVGR